MVISNELRELSGRANRGEIDMLIDRYDKLTKHITEIASLSVTDAIIADLGLSIAQSKVLANKIYWLRHRN
jgi:hypothetical protein